MMFSATVISGWPDFMILLPFLLGAGMSYRMYRLTIVPSWRSGWGLLGILVSLTATLCSGFTQYVGFSSFSTALNAPSACRRWCWLCC